MSNKLSGTLTLRLPSGDNRFKAFFNVGESGFATEEYVKQQIAESEKKEEGKYVEKTDIQDTLNSDNSNKPLSANQGKVLKGLLDAKVIEAGAVPMDTEPTEGNVNNVVSSDGLAKEFNKFNTEIVLGGVYDVSAHNNDAVFESLQGLLSSSNLSTLIPTSVRRGGMTIRFIQGSEQSSDNKYVQYRLMSATWSTNVADWQGVDDEPTAGSDNLVKSGGVADKISELGQKTKDIIFDSTNLIKKFNLKLDEGHYYSPSVGYTARDGYSCYLVPVEAGKTYYTYINSYVVYGSDMSIITNGDGNPFSVTTISTSSEAKFIALNYAGTPQEYVLSEHIGTQTDETIIDSLKLKDGNFSIYEDTPKTLRDAINATNVNVNATNVNVNVIKDSVDKINSKIMKPFVNVFNKDNILRGKAIYTGVGASMNQTYDNDGNVLFGQIWEIESGDIVRTNFAKTLLVTYYNSDGSLIGNTDLLSSAPFIAPASSKYFRIQRGEYSLDVSNIMITINEEVPDKYVEYEIVNVIDKTSKQLNDLDKKAVKKDLLYTLQQNCKMVESVSGIVEFENVTTENAIVRHSSTKKFSNKAIRVCGVKSVEKSWVNIPVDVQSWESLTFIIWASNDMIDTTTEHSGYLDLWLNDKTDYNHSQYFNGKLVHGWNYVTLTKADFKSASSILSNLYVGVNARNTVQNGAYFGDCIIDSILVDVKSKPTIILDFDQVWDESINNGGYQYAFDNNIPLTLFQKDYMLLSQARLALVKEMHDNHGWEIANYTQAGGSGNGLVERAEDYSVADGYVKASINDVVKATNFRPYTWGCTMMICNQLGRNAIVSNGYKGVRYGTAQQTAYYDKDMNGYIAGGSLTPQTINSNVVSSYNTMTIDQIKRVIDHTIKYGLTLRWFTHGVCDDGQQYMKFNDSDERSQSDGVEITKWKSMIDYLKQKIDAGLIQAITFEEYYRQVGL